MSLLGLLDCAKMCKIKTHLGSVLLVIPVSVVNPLPEELHRGDGAALVHLGQVEVIDEDDALLAHGGAVHSLPPPVQLGHDHI